MIGLEVHAQLLTRSKLFCADSIAFGAEPNTQVSPISLAHPGTLPVINRSVIELAIRLGLALDCQIARDHYFARKNYFYPDLPKGYQVSQHAAPVCTRGYMPLLIEGKTINVELNRIHIEEDAGKSIHDLEEDYTCVDLNRAGTPLLEIVTEPCLHSAAEASAFLTELRKLLRWTDVCDGNMEEGSMRCDANISIRPVGESSLGTRVEVKNLNSIRNVKKAIEFEIDRLVWVVENGETVIQETRSFDADKGTTFALRSKEEAEDYRYFPEPDLPPFHVSDLQLAAIKEQMPMLPGEMEQVFRDEFQLSAYDASVLCNDRKEALFYQEIVADNKLYKATANWILGPLKAYCNDNGCALYELPLTAVQLSSLIAFAESGKVSFQAASSRMLPEMLANGYEAPGTLAQRLNVLQETDDAAMREWVETVVGSMPDKVKEYRSGKKALLGLFAGQVKKLSHGKADMQLVNTLLEEQLNKV